MNTIVIFYKGANQHSVSAGPTDKIVLNPGQNVVDEETWNKIVKISEKEKKTNKGRASGVCLLMEENLVKILGSDNEEDGFDFEKLNQKDAIDLVNSEIDIETLETFYITENDDKNREKVLDAIDKQIDKLKKADS